MRIAHVVGHGALNGVATSTRTLIEAQLSAGHDVILVHPVESWIGQQTFSRPIERVATTFKTRPDEIRRIGRIVRAWSEDILHAHGSKANKIAMIYRLLGLTPTVMTAHTRLFQLPWRFAHCVIAPSQQTAGYYLKRRLVPRSRMQVIPHIFDIGAVTPVTDASRAAARAGLGIRHEAFVLGSVGEVSDRKNQIDQLRILRRALASGVDAELLLIGKKLEFEQPEAWNALMADPLLAGRVHLAGHRADAVALLHALDAYLCTARIEEGPIATLEAMATCLPVLTVDVGFSRLVVRDDVNGRVFPMGAVNEIADACRPLADDRALCAAWGREGRQAVATTLDARIILPQIEAAYGKAIERSGRGSMPPGKLPSFGRVMRRLIGLP